MQVGDGYGGGALDATAFVDDALAAAITGRETSIARLAAVNAEVERHPHADAESQAELLTWLAVRIDRNARADELRCLPLPDEEVDAALRRLARRGLITFDERFGWNAETDAPFGAT